MSLLSLSGKIALTYPELYKDLSKGRSLSYKTFFTWCLISIYQGGVIMFGALLLFEDEFIHVVSISFTALILTELIMVALTIRTWHWLMIIAEFLSLAIYILSLIILKDFFGKYYTNWDESDTPQGRRNIHGHVDLSTPYFGTNLWKYPIFEYKAMKMIYFWILSTPSLR